MIKGILFDKDGTIIDFFKVWEPAIQPVLRKLISDYQLLPAKAYLSRLEEAIGVCDGKIDPEGAIAWKPYPLIAEDLRLIFQEKDPNLDIALLTQKLETYFTREVRRREGEVHTFTDTARLFSALQQEGIKIGVVTTDNLESTLYCLSTLGLTSYVSLLGTADNGRPIKPDGTLLLQAAQEWHCDPREIAVVGDTPNDMRFAQNGGGFPIGVLSGTGTRASMKSYTDCLIPSIADLGPVLEILE